MKVNASLADVKTTYEPIPAGTDAEFKLAEISRDEETGAWNFKSVLDEPGHEHYGKPVYDYMGFTTREGKDNKFARAQFKRYFEAIVGEERANAEDLDTDEILNGRFRGVVDIEEYDSKKHKNPDGTPKKAQSNKFSAILPL